MSKHNDQEWGLAVRIWLSGRYGSRLIQHPFLLLYETHSAPPFTGPAAYLIGPHGVWWILGWILMFWLGKAYPAMPAFTLFPALSEIPCYVPSVPSLHPGASRSPSVLPCIAHDREGGCLFWKLPSPSCVLSTANCHLRSTKEGDISCTVGSEVNIAKFWEGGFLPKCRTWGEI